MKRQVCIYSADNQKKVWVNSWLVITHSTFHSQCPQNSHNFASNSSQDCQFKICTRHVLLHCANQGPAGLSPGLCHLTHSSQSSEIISRNSVSSVTFLGAEVDTLHSFKRSVSLRTYHGLIFPLDHVYLTLSASSPLLE